MAQLMPLSLTVSCFSKIQIGLTFLVPAHPGSPGQRAVKRVCVCVCGAVRPRCSSLSWGESEASEFARQHGGGGFDLLLGADVVFWPDSVLPLLQTVHCFLAQQVRAAWTPNRSISQSIIV